MNKEKYKKDIIKRFSNKTRDLLLHQLNLFYEEHQITKRTYEVGEDVKLSKGTFIHGIPGLLDNFDFTVENGFISTDFTSVPRPNKICNSVGMWNIKKNCLLKDYINEYSGFTITYTIGRGPDSKQSFIPSLVSNKRQIAFILNMESEYANALAVNDVWNPTFDEETIKPFLDYRYFPKFLDERNNRNASTTDRESATAIMFGLPSTLIEGVLVGKKIENNQEMLNHIKDKLPDCYICNLEGKVIIGNKNYYN